MKTILAISGSLRSQSSNTRLVQAIVGLAPPGITIEIYNGIARLPHFNPELEGAGDLVAVEGWRTQLQAADGVLFCTPEYAHGVPGTLKNALDWIVSSGEFMNKPTAVISASPSPDGGEKANASLVQTLRVMMADIQEESILCISAISAKINAEGEITDTSTEIALRSILQGLISKGNGLAY
ncbi:NADPH-dependent FMN reductase [Acaryochloris sp. CCMEE 5410]|uniref:NADPH-dependent FMN reductase n=1 Tax=Acaryochloris sp. CCMEE 5410 TaxID=310037 RepID=UPI0002484691|nr:NAD(P)H-dependent oxidoreductase [Acaryochloris sp. CCMEE 5410]KAI9134284.1 NAD(P)H-dependent oxidoreductase [Acaryochloris sp. CCMEE 5410]